MVVRSVMGVVSNTNWDVRENEIVLSALHRSKFKVSGVIRSLYATTACSGEGHVP